MARAWAAAVAAAARDWAAATAAAVAAARDCAAAAPAAAAALDGNEGVDATDAVFAPVVAVVLATVAGGVFATVFATVFARAELDAAAEDEAGGADDCIAGEAIDVADTAEAATSAHVRLAIRVPNLPVELFIE
jgi:hypothetical protein